MQMLVKDIVKACNGVLLCGDPETVITSVETDSRLIEPGALFVPIIGQKTDAHQYIQQTFDKGAVAALTQEHTSMEDSAHCWIYVEQTQDALQQNCHCLSQPISSAGGRCDRKRWKNQHQRNDCAGAVS